MPERRDVYAPVEPADDPLGPWKTLNAMLAENPPPAHHALVLNQFARIGIGPGLDVEAQPDVVKQGLIRAAAIGMAAAASSSSSAATGPPSSTAGATRRPRRAASATTSCGGPPTSPWPASPPTTPPRRVYLVNFDDADGAKLSPDGRYELHFDADDLPPVDAFWSLAAYTAADLNLIPNPADRYSVGDRTPGLQRDPDGGLTIHLQPEPPGADAEPNWLPTSAEHAWFVILRMYRPHPAVVEANWECPADRAGELTRHDSSARPRCDEQADP